MKSSLAIEQAHKKHGTVPLASFERAAPEPVLRSLSPTAWRQPSKVTWEDVAALILDEHGTICDCNNATLALFQYGRGELLQQHISLLLPQLARVEVMRDGAINPRLRFLSHIGHSFQAVKQDGECFAGELFLNMVDHQARDTVSLMVRPTEGL